MKAREIITRIRLWCNSTLVLIIRKLTNREDWFNGKDDFIRRIIARLTKKGMILMQKLGYELIDEGMEIFEEL